MSAIMIASMTIRDDGWLSAYAEVVPGLLAEYGARQIAGTRTVRQLEGEGATPDRIAIFSFPSMDAIDRFMADPRYHPFRDARRAACDTDLYVFEDSAATSEFV